jgi:hypothetical protein
LVQPFALQCQLGFDQRDIVGKYHGQRRRPKVR